ncbi:MAG: EAL domain-containing protein [Actinomycetota bacterium]|nr:EAL domain-containing protein [Actinomycetota bacterium]
MTVPEGWATQRLAEFLAALTAASDEEAAVRTAVEHIAESFEAEVGAFLCGAAVRTAVGFPHDGAPEAALATVLGGPRGWVDIAGVGRCAALSVPVDAAAGTRIVLARCGSEGFDPEEVSLLRAMARVLALALRMLNTLDVERALRELYERQAEDNARLLASLQDRQALLEHLTLIQRAISTRAPLQQVLDAVTAAAAQLLVDDVVDLRLVDENDPRFALVVSGTARPVIPSDPGRALLTDGIGGRAVLEDRLLVSHDLGDLTAARAWPGADDLAAAMAAPVREHGVAVGSLVVASHRPDRQYSQRDREVLTALAEHASLALNDARTVRAMYEALDDATHQALHDSLTGLPNRALFMQRLDRALSLAMDGSTRVAVLFVDLDDFKTINDSLGHARGDRLLIAAARRIREFLDPAQTAARLGGDEFAVLLEDVERASDASDTAQGLLDALSASLQVDGDPVFVNASVGVALSDGGEQAGELLRNADVAMYRAKTLGKGRVAVFEGHMHAAILNRVELEADLRRALNQGQIRVDYQPIVRLDDARVSGVEALARWSHPGRGPVPPSDFIPLAEEIGLIVPLGRWVLREACRQVRAWQRAYPADPPLVVSVNVSGRQLQHPDFVAQVNEALEASGLDAGSLSLEITETILMRDTEATVDKLRALKKLGVRLAIDDFGTGYSSLSYLRRFPIDVLKIDKSFVDGLTAAAGEATLVDAIVKLGHTLRLQTVAEGVERAEQLERLRSLGCPLAQGYLFARPLRADALDDLLAARVHQPTPAATAGSLLRA